MIIVLELYTKIEFVGMCFFTILAEYFSAFLL